jgi:hypothetical protein
VTIRSELRVRRFLSSRCPDPLILELSEADSAHLLQILDSAESQKANRPSRWIVTAVLLLLGAGVAVVLALQYWAT